MNKKNNDKSPLDNLFNSQYTEEREIIFNQYELYVKMVNQISNRRVLANTFYLSANSIILVAIGIVVDKQL